jgi:hypothetical protein
LHQAKERHVPHREVAHPGQFEQLRSQVVREHLGLIPNICHPVRSYPALRLSGNRRPAELTISDDNAGLVLNQNAQSAGPEGKDSGPDQLSSSREKKSYGNVSRDDKTAIELFLTVVQRLDEPSCAMLRP